MRSLARGRPLQLRCEAQKRVLLCSNCHAEVEGAISSVSGVAEFAIRGSSMAEQDAVNVKVVGSSPTPGASST